MKPTAQAAGQGASRYPRGKSSIDEALARAAVTIENTYITPIQNHNPMEPHATIAWWDGDKKLNVYDATQYISGDKMSLARMLNIPLDNVRVQCPYTGGGFGCKGSTWSHVILAAMAAKVVRQAGEARAGARADVRAGGRAADAR